MPLMTWVMILVTFSSVAVLFLSFLKLSSHMEGNSFLSKSENLRVWVIVIEGIIRFLLWLVLLLFVVRMAVVKMPRLVRQLASIYPTSNSWAKLSLELSSISKCCFKNDLLWWAHRNWRSYCMQFTRSCPACSSSPHSCARSRPGASAPSAGTSPPTASPASSVFSTLRSPSFK